MDNSAAIYVYEWNAWEYFLLPAALPGARRIPAHPGENYTDVAARVQGDGGTFIFHLNLTETSRIPAGRVELCEHLRARGARVLNGRVTDISKRALQDTCRRAGLRTVAAARAGAPDDTLIVKSNLNYGGLGESWLTADDRLKVGLKDAPRWPDYDAGSSEGERGREDVLEVPSYRILPRCEVGPDVWDSADLVVENYVGNSRDLFYRVHLLGGHVVISRVFDAAPIKKFPPGIQRDDWHFVIPKSAFVKGVAGLPAPTDLVEDVLVLCRSMGLDFGALDVVQDDAGAFYIVDVNSTPWWGKVEAEDEAMIRFLGSGLW
jgi:hypothetical protein